MKLFSDHDLEDGLKVLDKQYKQDLHPNELHFLGIRHMDPTQFIFDGHAFTFGSNPSGWLLKHRRTEWFNLLEDEYHYDFSRILGMYDSGTMQPAIQINGFPGDGMRRAQFYYSVGKYMAVAVFHIENPAKLVLKRENEVLAELEFTDHYIHINKVKEAFKSPIEFFIKHGIDFPAGTDGAQYNVKPTGTTKTFLIKKIAQLLAVRFRLTPEFHNLYENAQAS